ncbi:MAG: cation diffusion facilitator family transporter [Candidatus Odinarchaeota archaeon]
MKRRQGARQKTEKLQLTRSKEEKQIQKSLVIAIVIIVTLVVLKIISGVITGSIGLVSDAIHSVTDLVVVITALIGVVVANRSHTKQFPFGLHKVENLVSLGISILILITGLTTLLESLNRLNTGEPYITLEMVGISTAGTAVLASLVLFFYLKRVASSTGSPTLDSLSTDYRMDVLVSTAVLIGIISSFLRVYLVDSLAGIFVSFFILLSGIMISKDSLLVLLDRSVDDETLRRIKTTLSKRKVPLSTENEIRAIYRGRFIFLELDVGVPGHFSIQKTDLMSRELIQELKLAIPRIGHVSIRYKTAFPRGRILVGVPLDNQSDLMSRLSSHFGEAPYLAVVEMENGKIVDYTIEENPFIQLERQRGIKVAEWFANKGLQKIAVHSIPKGSGPVYVLRDKGIELQTLNANILQDLEHKKCFSDE